MPNSLPLDFDSTYVTARYTPADSMQSVISDLEKRIAYLEDIILVLDGSNPGLHDAWEQYQIMKTLTK